MNNVEPVLADVDRGYASLAHACEIAAFDLILTITISTRLSFDRRNVTGQSCRCHRMLGTRLGCLLVGEMDAN